MKKLVSMASVAALAAIAVFASAPTLLGHGLHTSCMYGPTQPNDQGPSSYHTTPEAGVHISCTPPKGPKEPELKQEQRQRDGNAKRQ
jgi:hypothetical protein